MSTAPLKTVLAAVIEKDGRVLAARRAPGKRQGGLWEFPGGKLEDGETHEQGLARELREEFGIQAQIRCYVAENVHDYGEYAIRLVAYRARWCSGEFTLSDHSEIRWLRPEELPSLEFAPADIPLVEAVVRAAANPLPKIILIGDSIRMGYDRYVRDRLAGRADVLFPGENCAFAQNVLRKIDMWQTWECWGDDAAIVHWNAGLWDTLNIEGDGPLSPLPFYADCIVRIHRRLRRHFPKATLVFATSTPVNEAACPFLPDRFRRNAQIEEYNRTAVELLSAQGERIDDLYAVMAEAPESDHSDWTHWYTPGGTKRIGDAVVRSLASVLPQLAPDASAPDALRVGASSADVGV